MEKMKLNIQKFAGYPFEFGADGYLQGRIIWSSSINGNNAGEQATYNSSNVTATLQVHRTNSATTTGTWTGSLNINGDNRNFSWRGSVSNNWVTVSSFTVTVEHNPDGNKTCYIGGSVSAPSGTSLAGRTSSGSQNVALDKINRYAIVTNANNFNDEENPSMTFSNPGGFSIDVWLEPNPNSEHLCIRRNIANTGTFTWELTNEEREQLRSACTSSSCIIRYGIKTTIDTETFTSYQDKTLTIINANPIFNNFEFEDINPVTLALTGDNSKNVNGYSTIKATISTTNKAEAIKSAKMSKYRFSIDTQNIDINYSTTENVYGTIKKSAIGTYNVYAIDSRNNSTLVTKLASQNIEYIPISFNSSSCKVERNNSGVGGYAVLTLSGNIWNDNFGQVTNSIKSVLVEYKETNSSTWLESPTVITPSLSNNIFTFTGQVASQEQDYTFELNKSYDFRVTIKDELSEKTINLTPMASAVPNISLADNGVGIMCDYDESLGGSLQVDGKRIDAGGSSGGTLLWTNPNPTSAITGNVTVNNMDDYDVLEIFYYPYINTPIMSSTKAKKGEIINLITIFQSGDHGYLGNRTITYINSTTLRFDVPVSVVLTDNFGRQAVTDWCIPIYIVGYKTEIFN